MRTTTFPIPAPKAGIIFTRACIALMRAGGRVYSANEFADAMPHATAIKSAIAAGTTSDSDWAEPLASTGVAEFSQILREGSIAGRLAGARRPPLNVSFTNQTATAEFAWTGQGSPAPVSALALERVTVGASKISGVIIITKELASLSTPQAEQVIQDDLTKGAIAFLDRAFIDPGRAAVANVSPAAITHGLSAQVSSGNSIAQITADLTAMVVQLADDNEVGALFWVLSRADCARLASKRGANGEVPFPNVTVNGGELFGIPIIASNSVARSLSGGSTVTLINADGVTIADDPAIGVNVSVEASVQLDNAPAEGAQPLVSLWQSNLIGLRLTTFSSWRRTRDSAVAVMTGVHW